MSSSNEREISCTENRKAPEQDSRAGEGAASGGAQPNRETVLVAIR